MSELLRTPEYVVEGIILRRIYEKRIEGYTIETAKEIAAAISGCSATTDTEIVAALEDIATIGEGSNTLNSLPHIARIARSALAKLKRA